jgi:hypothetical protein
MAGWSLRDQRDNVAAPSMLVNGVAREWVPFGITTDALEWRYYVANNDTLGRRLTHADIERVHVHPPPRCPVEIDLKEPANRTPIGGRYAWTCVNGRYSTNSRLSIDAASSYATSMLRCPAALRFARRRG